VRQTSEEPSLPLDPLIILTVGFSHLGTMADADQAYLRNNSFSSDAQTFGRLHVFLFDPD